MQKKHYLQITPDEKFNSIVVTKFVNMLMQDGKKTTAYKVFYDAMDLIEKRFQEDKPLHVFEKAVNNVKPHLEVKSKRVGGATYQVPMEVAPRRQQTLAIRWLVDACRKVKGKKMAENVANELSSAFKKEGNAYRKREETHRMAEANKAFAHFR